MARPRARPPSSARPSSGWGRSSGNTTRPRRGAGRSSGSPTWLERPGTVGPPVPERPWRCVTTRAGRSPDWDRGHRVDPGPRGQPVPVPQGPGEDRRSVAGRVVHGRGRGDARRGRLPVPDRPERESHHLRGRQHLSCRGRCRASRAPGGRRRGHHRRAQRRVGRGGQGDRRAPAGNRAPGRRWRPSSSLSAASGSRTSSAHGRWTSRPCLATTPASYSSDSCATGTDNARRGLREGFDPRARAPRRGICGT